MLKVLSQQKLFGYNFHIIRVKKRQTKDNVFSDALSVLNLDASDISKFVISDVQTF